MGTQFNSFLKTINLNNDYDYYYLINVNYTEFNYQGLLINHPNPNPYEQKINAAFNNLFIIS